VRRANNGIVGVRLGAENERCKAGIAAAERPHYAPADRRAILGRGGCRHVAPRRRNVALGHRR
jgi:hypothetical protein